MSTIKDGKTKIADIINKRDPFLKTVEEKRDALIQMAKAIRTLDELCQQILNDGSPTMKESLRDIDLKALVKATEEEAQRLRKPISRFKRKTLNIGVLGQTGQGKSTLLLSLSKLPAEVIPTGRGSYCTGARSLIMHDDAGKAGADIHFYSEREFISEVLTPYYKALNLKLSPPHGIDSFKHQDLPEDLDSTLAANGNRSDGQGVAGRTRSGHTTLGEMYRHLRNYQEHIDAYRGLIGHTDKHIPISDVREYVAQEDIHGKLLYNHLAVKEAVITHRFGDLDVERVGLLDMPGLGDMRIADEEHLVKALEEQIDIVLFVIKPDAFRGVIGNVNFGLYDIAYDALEGISLKESSFIVLNHRKSRDQDDDNGENCERLKREIMGGERGVKGRRVEVHDCLIADCHDAGEAHQEVLEPILDYLVANMAQLDKTYMDFWSKRIAELREKIETVLRKVSHLSGGDTSRKDEEEIFKANFHQAWDSITSALEKLLVVLRKQSNETNNEFAAYFTEKFNLCRSDTGLPATAKDVKDVRDREGDYPTAFARLLHHARTHLMQHFSDMDERLKVSMNGVKAEVATIFIDQGKLGNLLVDTSATAFFTKMTTPEMGLLPHLQATLQAFGSYQLWFRGYFQSLIRNNGYLDSLVPDKTITARYYIRYISSRLDSLEPRWGRNDKVLINALKNTVLGYIAATHPAGSLVALLATFFQNYPNLDTSSKAVLSKEVNALILDERQQNLADPKPEELLQALKDAQKATVDLLEANLKTFFTQPGKATLAAVEEFTDQALRASNARENWDSFYRNYMVQIWRDEFSQSQKWRNYNRQWQIQVDAVLTATRKL